MKQHISVEQLNGLTDKGKEKLLEWLFEKGYLVVATYDPEIGSRENQLKHLNNVGYDLSIGQMIEVLDDEEFFKRDDWSIHVGKGGYLVVDAKGHFRQMNIELCDALWEACKEVLNNE